jgi:3-methyladenine DNA glycosylase/8-oxoguanine DNA glycosylase
MFYPQEASMNMTLPAQPPFSLPTTIRSHGWIQLAPFASDDDYQTFSYVAQLATERVVSLHVQQEGDGVRVTVDQDLSDAERAEVAAQVTWVAALDRDLTPFHTMARSEPKLAHVVERTQGRILRSPTLFEDTVKTILTTNTAWSGTRRMVRALVDLYGQPLAGDSSHRAFPTPERLADVDAEALRQEAKLGYRAPYVHELAQRVATGDLDLEALKTADLPTPELRRELLAIKGIGNYATANLLMLLDRSDFIPIDSYAMKMVSNEFHDGEPIGAKEVEAAFADWGEWKGMAFWFWDWRPTT